MCNEWKESTTMIRGVPFRIGKTPSGLWWGVGQAPMAPGGTATAIAEHPGSEHPVQDCAAKVALYQKLAQMVKDLEALSRQVMAHRAATEGVSPHAVAGAIGAIGGAPAAPIDVHGVPLEHGRPLYHQVPARYFAYPNETDIVRRQFGARRGPQTTAPLGRNAGTIIQPRSWPWQIMGPPPSYGVGAFEWLNPMNLPSTLNDAINTLGKPAAYALAFGTAGAGGLAAAWASDATGVMDVLQAILQKAGGILIDVIASTFFSGACVAVSKAIEVPEMGLSCLLASIAVEIAKAIGDRNWGKLANALQRVVSFASQYFDPVDALQGVLEGVLQAIQGFGAYDLLESFFGDGLNKIQEIIDGVLPHAQAAMFDSIVDQIRLEATNIAQRMGHELVRTLIEFGVPYEVGRPWAVGSSDTLRKVSDAKTTDPNKVPHGPAPATSQLPILTGIVKPTRSAQAFNRQAALSYDDSGARRAAAWYQRLRALGPRIDLGTTWAGRFGTADDASMMVLGLSSASMLLNAANMNNLSKEAMARAQKVIDFANARGGKLPPWPA